MKLGSNKRYWTNIGKQERFVAEVKLTKNDLRIQQSRLAQLEKYLPTLQLKKTLLQLEVNESLVEIGRLEDMFQNIRTTVNDYCAIFSEKISIDPAEAANVVEVQKKYDNIAGVEIPVFLGVVFAEVEYSLFDTP